LTLSGTDTVVAYQNALRAVTYQNTSDAPTTLNRTVSFSVNDGISQSSALTRDIAITAVNDTPTAVADTATAVEAGGTANGTAGTNPTGNVLTNDTDVDAGETKTVSGVAAGTVGSASTNVGAAVTGSFGSITIAADGSYTYTVDNNNAAVQALRTPSNTLTDVFTYTMRDTAGLTSTTQITVTIQGANDVPTNIIASPIGSAAEQVYIPNASSAITVDGVASESIWSSFEGQPANRSIIGGEHISSSTDLSASVRTAWDSQNLYFLIQVTDSQRFINTTNTTFWNGDGVELYLDIGNDSTGSYGANDYQFVINAAGSINLYSGSAGTTIFGSGNYTTFNPADFVASVVDSGSGYVLEVRLAWAALGQASPSNLTTLGLGVAINDDDTGAGAQSRIAIEGTGSGAWSSFGQVGTGILTTGATPTVAENATTGTLVGSVRGIDGDTSDTFTYELLDNASGRFAINPTTGNITVADGSLLNFEASTSHSINVRVTDAAGLTYNEWVTIQVTDVNEVPVAVVDAATAVEAGGTSNGTAGNNPTGNVLTNDTDPDSGDTKTVTGVLAGVQASAAVNVGSAVNGSFGSITIAADGSYTYTVNNSNATVQALRTTSNTLNDVFTYTTRDTAGLTSTTQITVTIQGSNDAPTVSQVTGAVAAYDFENGSGNSPSVVSSAPAMTVGGTVTYAESAGRTPGSEGLLFTAVGNSSTAPVTLSSIPNVATTGAITVSSWVRFDAVDAWGRVFDFGVGGNAHSFILGRSLTSDNLVVRYHDASGVLLGQVAATNALNGMLGAWMHVSTSLDTSGVMSLYVNGTLIGTTNVGAMANLPEWTSNRIGSSNWTGDALFRGAIDDFAIFDRVLTAGEVATLASTVTAPTIVNKSIAENSANGTNVFDARSSDVDSGDGVTYSILSGNTNSTFAINSTSGQVTVANSSMLNFEANSSYTLVVRAIDTAGLTTDQAVTVTVTDVNEAPTDITLGSAPTGLTTAGSASLVTGTTYQLTPTTNNQAGAVWGAINLNQDFVITSQAFFGSSEGADGIAFALQNQGATSVGGFGFNTGVGGLTSAFGVYFDTHYNVTHNNNIDSAFSQFFQNGVVANQGMAFDSPNAHDNLEDGQWRDIVVNWNATSKTLSYSLDGVAIDSKTYDVVATNWAGNANGWFGFTAGTGSLNNQHQVRILNVQTGSGVSVAENAANGTVVGIASAIDPDRTGTLTYSFTNNAGGRFAIDNSTGQITVANGSLLDFETSRSHTVVVQATDQGSQSFSKTLTINVTNVNEAPTALTNIGTTNLISNGSFESGSQGGTPTGWTATAPGGIEGLRVGKPTDGSAFYALGGWANTGGGTLSQNITTVAGTTYTLMFDAGAAGSDTVPQVLNVQALNGASVLLDQTITDTTTSGDWTSPSMQRYILTFTATGTTTTIRFADNSGATTSNDLDLDNVQVYANANPSVNENATSGTVVTTMTASDPDHMPTFSYSLTNNAGGRFAINSTTGQITVASGAVLDHEVKCEPSGCGSSNRFGKLVI
jgi:VCBS repeat-containing protein